MRVGMILAGSMLAAEAIAASSGATSAEEIVAALAGEWSNAAQYRSAPDALKVEPSVDGEWIDHQHAVFQPVTVPRLGQHVLYLEWRRGGPDGAISRQRLWSFRADADGAVRMDFHAFVDGAPFAGRGGEAGAFAEVTPESLRSYAPECALRFSRSGDGWIGRVTAEECRIVAASGRAMGIDATVELGSDGVLSYREAGRLDDGRYAFRVPPTMPYRFERISSAAAPAPGSSP